MSISTSALAEDAPDVEVDLTQIHLFNANPFLNFTTMHGSSVLLLPFWSISLDESSRRGNNLAGDKSQ